MRKFVLVAAILAAGPAAALDVNGSGGERLGAPNVYFYDQQSGRYSDFDGNMGSYDRHTGQTMIWRRDGSISTGQYNSETGFGYQD